MACSCKWQTHAGMDAGLPLMFLSRLSHIVLVLNHPFPPPPSPHAHCLLSAKGLDSVTAQCHLLIKTNAEHPHKPVLINACAMPRLFFAVTCSPLTCGHTQETDSLHSNNFYTPVILCKTWRVCFLMMCVFLCFSSVFVDAYVGEKCFDKIRKIRE